MNTSHLSRPTSRPSQARSVAKLSLAAAVATVLASHSAQGVTVVWDGGGVGGTDLGVGVNWAGDVLPSVITPDTMRWDGTVGGALSLVYSDAAYAGAAGNTGVDLDIAATQAGSLNIDSGVTNTNGFRLNNVTIASGAGAFSLGNSANVFNLTLGGLPGQTHTWTNNSATGAVVASDVAIALGGGGFHTLSLGGTGNWNFNNIIGQGTGTLGLVKTGSGTLTLSGASTFTGGLTISAGTVVATTSVLALGTGIAPVVVSAGANLNFGTANLTYGTNIAGAGTINANTLGATSNSLGFTGNLSGFTGTLNIGTGGGRVRFQNASGNQISSLATINVLSGATLLADNPLTYGNSIFLNGGITGEALGQLRIEAGANWSGSVTLLNNTTIGGNTSAATISGVISGAGFGFTRLGSGITILTNANTYTGATVVSGGSLQLGNSGTTGTLATASAITVTGATLAINRSNAVAQGTDFTGAAISGTGNVEQRGTGTTTLSAGNTYTGTTTVSRGTLKLDFTAVGAPASNIINNVANSSALVLAHGTLNLTGLANTTNSQRFNGLTLNAGASVIQLSANATANPLLLTLGAVTHNAGGTVDFALPTGTQSGTNGVTTSTANVNGILGGYATVAGTDWAAVSGGNIVGYSTVGVYTLSSVAGNTAASYLNLIIDVDSSPTPAAAITPNSLRFNTAAATTLTLTGTNVVTSGGILVNGTVGNNLSTITGGTLQGASGKDLVIFQNNTGNALTIGSIIANNTTATGLTKSGNGVLTLTGSNTYTGPTVLNAGTLNVNNVAALGNTGTGALVISGGTLDNTSGAAIITSAAKAQNWNGDFTFTGTNNLSLTGGALTGSIATIGGPTGIRTATISAGTLTINNLVGPAGYDFVKAGAGTLALTSTTNITNANATSLVGTLNVAGGKIQVAADASVGGLMGSGTIENGGPASKWFFAGSAGLDSTFSGTIQDGPTAGVRLGLVKQGGGTLTLSGTNTPGDALRVDAGVLRITGTTTVGIGTAGTVLVGTTTNQNAVLWIDGGTLNASKTSSPSIHIAGAANSSGFLRMTSGVITTVSQLNIGNGSGAATTNPYAAFTMSGGTVTSGSWLVVGANNDRAVLNQSGGNITVSANRMTIGAGGNNSFGLVNLSGGTFTDNAGIFLGENGAGVLNISGSGSLNLGPTGTMQFAGNATSLAATLNLLGGTLSANAVTKGASTAGGVYLFNFNGGTLRATANNTNFFAPLANTTAYVHGGGAIIDSNSFDVTIAQSLVAPTGNGVNGIASFTGGAGYIDTPIVTVLGDGFGATAVANVAGGVVTGITITNPGVGYTSTPSFTVFGGGATIPATITGTAPTSNSGGGLTKTGLGTLTLNTTHTYLGTTTVSGGTLLLSGSGDINAGSGVNINGSGARFSQTSSTPISSTVTLTNGILDGTTTYNSVVVANSATSILTHGNGGTAPLTINNLTFNDAATINLDLTSSAPALFTTNITTGAINGAGRVTINVSAPLWVEGVTPLISYTTLGGIGFSEFLKGTITGLSGRQTATLTNPAGQIALSIVGDSPVWTGSVNANWTTNIIPGSKNWSLLSAGTPTDFLTNDVVLFDDNGAITTVDINSANVSPVSTLFNNAGASYTIMSSGGFGIASGTVSILGGGSVTFTTTNTYSGATTVSAGTLNIDNTSAIGTGALILAAGATIDNTSGSAKTLTTNNVQTWTGDFVFGGSNDLDLGTGASVLTANRTITTNGTAKLTVGGVVSGVGFGLAKSGPGTLALGGANTYTGTTTVNAGTLLLTGSINAGNVANVGQVTVGTAADDAVLRISGGTLNATKTAAPSVNVGAASGGNGALYLTSGSLLSQGELWLGNLGGSYGSFTMDAGSVSFGSWVAVARSGSAMLNVNGGTLTVTGQNLTNASFGGAVGITNLTGGVTNITSVAANQGRMIVGEGGSGVLNVSGSAALNVSGAGGVHIAVTGQGIVNLNGGTVTTPLVQKGSGTGILNFSGGTLKASANAPTFLTGLTNAYIYSGGATIDSGTFAITVAQPLLAPAGDGVSATGLSVSGSGYISAPIVQIFGDGFGATAVANVDSGGNLTGITITNPGVGYLNPPSFGLVGGGAFNSGSITGTATLMPNVSGGLTKAGNGSLTLTGTNTYTGATVVSAGTVVLSGAGEINGSSGVNVNGTGAKLLVNSTVAMSPTVTLTSGTLDGTGTLNSVLVTSSAGNIIANGDGTSSALTINSLTFNDAATLNLSVASSSPVIATTALTTGAANAAGQVTINATNVGWTNGQVYNLISYTGGIGGIGFSEFLKGTITGLTARQSATLTNPAGFVALSIAGDSPVWTGLNSGNWTTSVIPPNKNWKLITGGGQTDFLTTDTVLFDDTATGTTTVSISTANVSPNSTVFNNGTNTYTVSSGGGFGIATGSLSKTGNGTVTINTNNTYTGGTTVASGTLNLTGNNNFGTGAVTVNGGTANFSGSNTYSGGTVVNGGNLIMSASNTFGTGTVTVNGGTATLGGTNTYSGLTTVTNGTLNINNAAALGSAALTITGGAIGNTSGFDLLLSGAKAQNWNGDFAYTGPYNLDFNLGAVTIGGATGSRTVTVAAGTLATGLITAPAGYGLTKAGPGILAMTNTLNTTTISGELNVTGGKIQIAGDFNIGGLTGSGTIENGGAASKWVYYNNAADNTFSGTIQDNPNNAAVRLGFVKRGTGTLTLSGANNIYSDRLAVEAGKLVLTGTNTTGFAAGANNLAVIGGIAAQDAVLEVNGGTLNGARTAAPSVTVGTVAGANGAINVNGGGTINATSELWVGSIAGAYGALTLNAGSVNSASWLPVGRNGNGVLNVNGGTLTVASQNISLGSFGGATGVMTVTGGTTNVSGVAANQGIVIVGEGGAGFLNILGGAVNASGALGVQLARAGGTGVANLNGGTVTTTSVTQGSGTGTLNFNGGILKASGNNPTFMQGLTTAHLNSGGGTIDDSGFAITIAQNFSAPGGNGVSATGLTVSGGGYIGAPLVQISGDGTGATAVAEIDGSGNLTAITITNPGINYLTAPTFTLSGGGAGAFGSVGGLATLQANSSGTLTKTGLGQTTFSGAIGSGTSSVNASQGQTIFSGAQTLASLTVANGAVLTFGPGPGPSPFGGGESRGAAPFESAGVKVTAVVPEPGSISLLMLGALGILGRRSRKQFLSTEK